jgi:hypothetical protein
VSLPPRFRSQVFSTSQRFPSKPEFRGLFSCRYRSWDPPFRVFPSQKSRTPLEAASSLAVIHRRAEPRRSRPYHRPFHRLPTLSRSCLDPLTPMSSLSSPPKERFPVTLGLNRRNRFVPPASPASKPSSSYESVRTGSGCPSPAADPLLGFSPSRAFQFTPRTLHPTRPWV